MPEYTARDRPLSGETETVRRRIHACQDRERSAWGKVHRVLGLGFRV
jgi:hypothetical protein